MQIREEKKHIRPDGRCRSCGHSASVLTMALVLLLVLSASFCACGHEQGGDGHGKTEDGVLHIVCTSFPGQAFAQAVAFGVQGTSEGETSTVEISVLSHKGQDLHGFEPSVADMGKIAAADLFIYVGGPSEAWVESTLKAIDRPDLVTLSMMEVCEAMVEEHPQGADDDSPNHTDSEGTEVEYDEHIWTSLANDVMLVERIAELLCRLDAAHADLYTAHAQAYVAELTALQTAYADMMAHAVHHAVVIADRYPFAYLFREIGLTAYAAFPGCSAETQASFATQVFLTEKVKELGLSYVCTVDHGQGSVADVICRETGAKALRLWSGQAWPDGDMTYLDMLRENLQQLTLALGTK